MDIEDDHQRAIIHIDIDCFYAQVEMNNNPELRNKPLGVQQKNIVVTCNYLAREYGIKKLMLIDEARKLCPNLTLVKGEDLHDYRQVSYKVTAHLHKYTELVERLGLDENYLDVTNLVTKRIQQNGNVAVVGKVFGGEGDDYCQCGCVERLNMASVVAKEIRESIFNEFQLTTSAGIAHNKLLAKLIGATHKPNDQTLLYPNSALELILHQQTISNIPGIGKATVESLKNINVQSIEDLQNCQYGQLMQCLGNEKAKLLKDLCYGKDNSTVRQTGRPQTIGLEDSCKFITAEAEIKEKLNQLLSRLIILIQEDGRIPKSIKLTVRKYDGNTKISHRESRQANIHANLFLPNDNIKLKNKTIDKLMVIIMQLFMKIVDVKRPYHITLLGLSFTKFLERATGKSSITNFLRKNIEVQTMISIENKHLNPNLMDYTNEALDFNTDGSESEIEPSPKKPKLTSLMIKRQRFDETDVDCPSPSKLRVAELRLNSKDTVDYNEQPDTNQNVEKCPPNVDVAVFNELPLDVQQELWLDFRTQQQQNAFVGNSIKQIRKPLPPKANSLLNYFVKK